MRKVKHKTTLAPNQELEVEVRLMTSDGQVSKRAISLIYSESGEAPTLNNCGIAVQRTAYELLLAIWPEQT